MKKYLLALGVTLGAMFANAQTDIDTKLVFADTVNYPFTSEWQYLTTDIYLFNPQQFDKVINEMNFHEIGRKKKKKKLSTQQFLEYLFVSAQLKNVKYFGNSDITYPLYNFQINRDKDQEYKTYLSDKIDHIRIIDNMPLYSAGNKIDAEIKVQAITNTNSDMLVNMIGRQLQVLSRVLSPTDAVLSLIGEFGSFLESNSKKREYRFSSTISLYEQQNFDTRLHSVKVFIMNTSKSDSNAIATHNFAHYLDTAQNINMNRSKLEQLVDCENYPYLVVLNYRSMYQLDQISGDDVTQDAVDERRARLLIDYKNGLISNETYQQERDFLRFLTAFVEFKSSIELYKLNQSSGNTGAMQKSLPKVMSRYNNLLSLHKQMDKKYASNPIYTSIFTGEYSEIVSFADMYLEGDPNLKNAKTLINTLFVLEANEGSAMDSLESEDVLNVLKRGTLLGENFLKSSSEGVKVSDYISQIENNFYLNYFRKPVLELKEASYNLGSDLTNKMLRKQAMLTNCELCKTEILAASDAYKQRNLQVQIAQALRIKDSLTGVWTDSVIEFMEVKECLVKNLAQINKSENKPVSFDLMLYNAERIGMHLNGLMAKLKTRFENPDLITLSQFNTALEREAALLLQHINFFRRNEPCYLDCNCNTLPLQSTIDSAELMVSTDSVFRALSINLDKYRQFDLACYALIDGTENDSLVIQKMHLLDSNRVLIDSLQSLTKSLPAKLLPNDAEEWERKSSKLELEIEANMLQYEVEYLIEEASEE